ncbi:MAG TPA: hypothetical protein VGR81_14020 [Candidatus Acidoferrales bacterium]|nr:hypothetical protein [Candidatus Acidoferrales bacterium]
MRRQVNNALRGVVADCEKYRAVMIEAATDGMAARQRTDFEMHVQKCPTCSEELRRAKMLLGEIDKGVASEVAGEPSADLLRVVWQRIAEEGTAKSAMAPRWLAIAACAAMVLAAVTWAMRRQERTFPAAGERVRVAAKNEPARWPSVPAAIQSSETSKIPGARTEAVIAGGRRIAVRRTQNGKREPEVLVPLGEMQLVMKLAAMLKSAQGANGATIVAGLKRTQSDQPLEIKPLEIAPLDATKEGGATAGGGVNDANPKFVDGDNR